MSRPPRGLSAEEAALWARVAATVKPLEARRQQPKERDTVPDVPILPKPPAPRVRGRIPPAPVAAPPPLPSARPLDRHGLDSSWDRKLAGGTVEPDFTLDLHGCTLDAAHQRLDYGLAQALAQGARVLLLITGKPRPTDDHASRGERRGAIRAKVLDWLAAGQLAHDIAAIRTAHRKHGGPGALYIVLRRRR